MLSLDHEILVDLFRENSRLAPALLATCTGIAVQHAQVRSESIDLSQVTPTGYRADNVVVLQDRAGKPVAGVIIEVQRHDDRDKLLAWPVYVAALRAKLDCPAVLLVVAPEPAVARWARRPIELGHPGFRLTPLVISFADVPRICDRSAASQLPQLAVLSVLAHPELETAEIAIEAISRLPERLLRLYTDVILKALPAEIRQILEARMIKGYEYQSDFARTYYGHGLEKGREEGLEKGREEGLRAAVITLARAKLRTVPADDLARIAAITDVCVLDDLVAALGQARTAFGARTVLARALKR